MSDEIRYEDLVCCLGCFRQVSPATAAMEHWMMLSRLDEDAPPMAACDWVCLRRMTQRVVEGS